MLTVHHLGKTSVRIAGGASSVVTFPDAPVADAICLLSSPQEFPSKTVLSWPGEYDIDGITVRGIGQEEGQKVTYIVEIQGVRIACLASPLGEWTDHELELLGDVHVLVLPAQDAKRCQKLLDDIDPRVLLLTPSSDGSCNQDVLKACGAVGQQPVSEWKLKGSLPQEGREVVVFG